MKISLDWLKTHIDLKGLGVDEMSDLLTFAGIEVEEIETRGVEQDSIVVARIDSSEKHPDADRLSICQVDDGSGELRQIVCGAKNYAVGDHVPLALPGTVFESDKGSFKIKASKMRGQASNGMLCSGAELGLEKESDGLLILAADAKPGTPVQDLFENDIIFTIEVTPNRPDLLSHLGTARDLAAIAGRELYSKPDHTADSGSFGAGDAVKVEMKAEDGCPFYTARRFTNVTVGESPDWLKTRLEAVGLRPINNVVDITNYVLMEMGQPLHAFDASKVKDGIVVRWGDGKEKLTALDGNDYELQETDVVIGDGSGQALAIGGVMGGEDSGVTEGCTEIILESAWFVPTVTRATSRRLRLSSDSSYRFERGVDPAQVEGASNLAAQLLIEHCTAKEEGTAVAAGSIPPSSVPEVWLNNDFVRSLLGADPDDLTDAKINGHLEKLGLEDVSGNNWKIPTYRADLQRPVDLVEEVARLHGLDPIPARNRAAFSEASAADDLHDFTLRLRQRLAALGCHEAITLKLISEEMLVENLGSGVADSKGVPLKNPMNDEQTLLRPTLVPGLLSVVQRNVAMGAKAFRFFETGTVFSPGSEHQNLAIVVAGDSAPSSWSDAKPEPTDLTEVTGLLEALLPALDVQLEPATHEGFPLGADLVAGGQRVGRVAQLSPGRARDFLDLEAPVLLAELDLETLHRLDPSHRKFSELPIYPAITRDISMEAPLDLRAAQLEAFFAGQDEPLLVQSRLFDLFTDPSGDKLAADRKSLAYTLTYRSDEKTLETAEVDTAHAKILEHLAKELPVTIRG